MNSPKACSSARLWRTPCAASDDGGACSNETRRGRAAAPSAAAAAAGAAGGGDADDAAAAARPPRPADGLERWRLPSGAAKRPSASAEDCWIEGTLSSSSGRSNCITPAFCRASMFCGRVASSATVCTKLTRAFW